jgi:Pentapeptide repeats (8 copies)
MAHGDDATKGTLEERRSAAQAERRRSAWLASVGIASVFIFTEALILLAGLPNWNRITLLFTLANLLLTMSIASWWILRQDRGQAPLGVFLAVLSTIGFLAFFTMFYLTVEAQGPYAKDPEQLRREKGNLSGKDLSSRNFSGVQLQNANLRGADLRGSDLSNADLRNTNLKDATLRSASLMRADLRGADLRSADLRNADLRDANLGRADLADADLGKADLRGTDLRTGYLGGATFEDAIADRDTTFPPAFDPGKAGISITS